MAAGLKGLLRLLAVAGMLMAFGQFFLTTATWIQSGFPDARNGSAWIGKRVKDKVVPPVTIAGQVRSTETAYQCQMALRRELSTWLHAVQPSGQWLALCGILYLLAGRSRDMAAVRPDDE